MQTMTSGTEAGSAVGTTRSSRMPWLIGVAVLAILAVIGAWWFLGDEGTPTMTFDGTEAVYDGPTTMDAGRVTFTFDASDYEPGVAMIIAQLGDDDITLEEIRAQAEGASAAGPIPPFVLSPDITFVTGDTPEERVVDHTVRLSADSRYLLTANTGPDDTDRVHPAAIIEVE